jgi:regulator of protease activity HflC (stomatin/prohibitin superfamily)
MFLTIDPGEKGVLFKRFGGGLEKDIVYGQGFHVIAPWNDMFVYDVKIHETFEKMEVLSKNGLSIKIDLSFRYMPVQEKIGYLHDEIGRDYLERIIKPEIRSVTREVIGNYLPEELYSTKREAIEDEIEVLTRLKVEAKYLTLDAILIRDVTLPLTLRNGIEKKLVQEQESLEYEFKIDKARKEAERKEIEANGIAKFQQIVNRTITPQLLKWKGVEATQEIAKSTNAKVIVIGNGDGDLPIILGGQ